MSRLLINEPPVMFSRSIAIKLGVNAAVFLQQLHYWLLATNNVRDGRKWVYKTQKQWIEEDLPFISEKTLSDIVKLLKNEGLILTGQYNKLKIDRTLWYSIDYDALEAWEIANCKEVVSMSQNLRYGSGENCDMDVAKITTPITREYTKNTQKNNSPEKMSEEKPKKVVVTDEHRAVIDYLNQKANTRYTYQSTKTISLLNKLFKQGRTVDDIKSVIDIKCSEWLPKQDMRQYLRPRTLFGEKFEDYLNQVPVETKQVKLKPNLQDRMRDIYGERWEELNDG